MKLSDLKTYQCARVIGFADSSLPEVIQRLMNFGVIEGAHLEVIHEAFGGDPFVLKTVDGSIALRKSEASDVLVELLPFRGADNEE